MKSVYLIGSLRNSGIRQLGTDIRSAGFDVFDDWHAAGEKADDCWMEYERMRGRTYKQALEGYAAEHTYKYDESFFMGYLKGQRQAYEEVKTLIDDLYPN